MKTKLLIGLGVVVILIIGMGLGYQGTKTIAKDYFLKDLIPSATLDEKDAFVESVSLDGNFQPKKLLENTKKAKNVIFLIGDGMSVSQVTAYRLLKGGVNSRIAVDKFPYSGIVLTHAENAIITDSASSATAYSTGFKTNNGALGMDSEKNNLENLTETLDRHGFVSSLLATSEVTHATPAAFAAHVDLSLIHN